MINKNNEIEKNNEMIIKRAKCREQNIRKNLMLARSMYERNNDILHTFYKENIIFEKYRNMIAVASFYEYFCSGRCSTLEGHEGAYNIYEQEMRLGIIINKLDEVIRRLDSIENNQYMLCSMIREGNKNTQRITDNIMSIANNMENIKEDASLIKYNSEITARGVDYICWLKANNL